MKRPMLYWAVLFILGEVFYKLVSMSRAIVYIIAMTMIMYVVVAVFRCKKDIIIHLGTVFFVCGMICFGYHDKKLEFANRYKGKEITAAVTVLQRTEKKHGTEYIVRAKRIEEKRVSIKLLFYLDANIEPGTKMTVKGEAYDFSTASNPGQYDEENYRTGKGIYLKLNKVSVENARRERLGIRRGLSRIHEGIKQSYERLFGEKEASLASAMVLGDKANVDEDVKKLYQRNGIAHLIAISGLHIAMIGGVLYSFLRKRLGSYSLAAGIGVSFIILYGVMTGLSESTIRAMIMLAIQIGADVFGRRYDSMSAIAMALISMLFCNPYQITQAGFLLSFGAVVGIALVNPAWKQMIGKMPDVFNALFVSLSVQLTLLPIILYYFYEIPLYGFLLNIIVIPLMGILLLLLLMCGVMGAFYIPLANIPAVPAKWIFALYEMLCKASEQLPFHRLCLGRPSIFLIIVYYIFLATFVAAVCCKKNFLRLALPVTAMIFLTVAFSYLFPDKLKICMFDVGQGDGIYVRAPCGTHILVDGGSSTKQNVGTYILSSGVKFFGAGGIDYAVVSHADSDHYSGIKELLESGDIRIKRLVLPDIANPDEAYRQLEQLGRGSGCELIYMKQGDYIKVGDVMLSCLNPEPIAYNDKNEGSLVLLLKYKNFDMLLTGDAPQNIESRIINDIKGKVEVLKVSHHGSDTASGTSFIKTLSPKVALISVGAKNSYGHPSKRVLDTLMRCCDKICLTKDCGAITIDSDGYRYDVSEFLKGAAKR